MTFCPNLILSADLRSWISRSLNDFTGKVTAEARTTDGINKLLAADTSARAPGSGTTTGRDLGSVMTGQNCGEQEGLGVQERSQGQGGVQWFRMGRGDGAGFWLWGLAFLTLAVMWAASSKNWGKWVEQGCRAVQWRLGQWLQLKSFLGDNLAVPPLLPNGWLNSAPGGFHSEPGWGDCCEHF